MKNADWALVISLGILWGMSFVFVELLLAYLSPFMIVYLRVAVGTSFLLAYIFVKKAAFDWSTETTLNFTQCHAFRTDDYIGRNDGASDYHYRLACFGWDKCKQNTEI